MAAKVIAGALVTIMTGGVIGGVVMYGKVEVLISEVTTIKEIVTYHRRTEHGPR